jgi:hypothetical protein
MVFVGLLAMTCAVVLGASEQDPIKEAEAGLAANPFQEVPGGPVGSEIYKSLQVSGKAECSGMCAADDDCSAYEWDANFRECKLMKTDMQKLTRQSEKAQAQVMEKETEVATKEAALIEKKQEEEKKKEEEDVAKVDETPIEKLETGPTARDKYRKAVRSEKEAKVLLKDRLAAHNELAIKAQGTPVVERVAKRHQQDVLAKFNAEQKVYRAAALNLEEQIMLRGNKNAKEVILAKGAKEEAEVTFDRIHHQLLHAKRMEAKAVDINDNMQKQAIQASQASIKAKLEGEKSMKALNDARNHYRSAEVAQKNQDDLKRQADASKAKTYLKMREMIKERDARAAAVSVTPDHAEADKKVKETCEEQQKRLKDAEFRIKEELSEEIGAKERARAEADIKRMEATSDKAVEKENKKEEEKLVAKAKEEAPTMELGEPKKADKSGAVIAAEEKATMEAAANKQAAATKMQAKAHSIRKAANQRIAAQVEEAWQHKKIELGIKEVNCEKPHLTTEERLREQVKQLQSEKLAASKTPPATTIDPVAAQEIENRVRQETQVKFDSELADMKKTMKTELETERKAMAKEKAEVEKKAEQADKEMKEAKAEAEQSKKSAEAAKEEAASIPKPPKQQEWGIMHRLRSMLSL